MHSDLYGGFWVITRYDDVTAAALDHESFTSAVPGMTIIPPSQPRDVPLLPLELDPPEHTRYRALVNPLFAKPRIDALRPDLEALATRLLEPIVRNGGGDVMAEFAHPMSLGSLARFMNLPEEDEAHWFDWVERMFSSALRDKADQAEAVRDAEAYIDALHRGAQAGAARRLPRDAARGGGGRPSPVRRRGPPVRDHDAARGLRDDLGRDGHEPAAPRAAPGAARAAVRRPGRARALGGQRAPALRLAGAGLRPQRGARRRRSTARRSPPATSSCSPTARRTTTRAPSSIPSAASSTATRTATSRSATAATCAWARTSPGSSSRS